MDNSVKFGIQVDKMHDQSWSFGMCLSHQFNETYVFINFFRWSVSIGWLWEE